MNLKLENLIEKIKKDGVQEAKKEAEKIIDKAKEEADLIVANAGREADKIVEEAKKEADKHKINADGAIKQAARDLVLILKEKIVSLFDNVLKKEVSVALTSDFLNELILRITDNWSSGKNLEILVNNGYEKKLQKMVFSSIKKELKNSVTIKVDNKVTKGFRLGVKGEDFYYDFSDETIAESLKEFLNPALAEILG